MVAVYGLVIRHHRQAWAQFRYDLFRWAVSCVLMALIVVLHAVGIRKARVDTLVLILYVVNEIVVWVGSRVLCRQHFHFPVNLEAFQSRWGVWIMIVVSCTYLVYVAIDAPILLVLQHILV